MRWEALSKAEIRPVFELLEPRVLLSSAPGGIWPGDPQTDHSQDLLAMEAGGSTGYLPGPDLVITDITAPAIVTMTQAFEVSWTGQNVGTASTPAGMVYDVLHFSTDDVLSADDVWLVALGSSGNPLEPGETYTRNYTHAVLPGGLPVGPGYLPRQGGLVWLGLGGRRGQQRLCPGGNR